MSPRAWQAAVDADVVEVVEIYFFSGFSAIIHRYILLLIDILSSLLMYVRTKLVAS
jgi:hypothetical protein